ncbi:Transmembrane and immunoglobulin domain-containing protein 2 [Heterocephalus glaber]|nr:Transmembrane and immunoglobulin domain-containing protein 2 [Heterocephalus glaber]
MGSPGWGLMLLVQLCALQGTTSLSVKQWPMSLRVTQGGQATLACQVTRAQSWERLRVEWTKDGDVICQLLLTKGTPSPGMCGPRAQLSWRAPEDITLKLDQLTLNDSGAYVCQVTSEIPELEKAEGNRTQLLVDTDGARQNQNLNPRVSGLLWPLLGAGAVVVAAVSTLGAVIWSRCRHQRKVSDGARQNQNLNPRVSGLLWPLLGAGAVVVAAVSTLGAVIWSRCRHQRKVSENPLYINVLYRARGVPKRSKGCPGEGKTLDTPTEEQKVQGVYSTSFSQPSTRLQQLGPKPNPSPRPDHPISTVRVSPGPGTSR